MHRIFRKNQILTLPNLLSVIRILLIPFIVWLYSVEKNYYAAIALILVSGITDIVDGWIARSFNMISDFGKALDPLADKLTQASLFFCLLSKYDIMWIVITIFGMCEFTKLTLGIVIAKKRDEVSSAKWYGKANTVFIYSIMMILILFPDISLHFANLLLIICSAVMIVAHLMYFRLYYKILSGKRNK